MIQKIIYTSIILLFIACNSKTSSKKMEHISTDFEFNKSITLTGIYVKSTISKREQGDHIAVS
ncbi:hypothetical protein D7036_13100 [Aquimarina sp. BL5]|nr:hypothetical protein D7036_13100 [Aquimarina sp. BL5]